MRKQNLAWLQQKINIPKLEEIQHNAWEHMLRVSLKSEWGSNPDGYLLPLVTLGKLLHLHKTQAPDDNTWLPIFIVGFSEIFSISMISKTFNKYWLMTILTSFARLVTQLCWLCILWTVAPQVALSMEFFRQECWRGLPFTSPGDLPNYRSNLRLLCLLHWRRIHYPQSHQDVLRFLQDFMEEIFVMHWALSNNYWFTQR